jgi:hypothetical protein
MENTVLANLDNEELMELLSKLEKLDEECDTKVKEIEGENNE